VKNFKTGDQVVSPFTVSWFVTRSSGVLLVAHAWTVENASTANMVSRQDVKRSCSLAQQALMELRRNM